MTALDLSTPDALRAVVQGIAAKLDTTAQQTADLSASVQAALTGATAPAAKSGGLDAFRNADGSLSLAPVTTDTEIRVGDMPALLRVSKPGLLDKSAAGLLPEAEAKAAAAARKPLGRLAALARVGYRGGLAPLSREIGEASAAVRSAPASIRPALESALSGVLANIGHRAAGTLASSSAATSGAWLDWVAEDIMADVMDLTATASQAGLGLSIPVMGGSLHATENLSVRLLTGIGGFRQQGRQTSNVFGQYALTDLAVSKASVTGARGVHSSIIDAVDLIDPRVTWDVLETHQRAAILAELATRDLLFLHGESESAPASHVYGAAGLALIGQSTATTTAAIDVDGRVLAESGGTDDMLLTCDGLVGMASDQSNDLDDATFGMASETEWLATVAGFVKFHNLAMARIREQYHYLPGTGYVLDFQAARALMALNTLTAGGQVFVTPVSDPANPWLVGRLYDGTPIYRHAFVGSGSYSTAGIPNATGGKNAAFLAAMSAIVRVQGPGHGSTKVENIPGTDAVQVSRIYHERFFNPVPSARKTALRVYGLDI
jgi:hypothetical protein